MSDFNPIIDNPKAYLDYPSHEYKSIEYDKRLTHIALFLHSGGNLQTFINEYRSRREKYITDTIYDTLMMNLVYLRMGEPITALNNTLKKKLNESQLVELLSAELRERSSGTPTYKDMGTFTVDIIGETRYDLDKYLEERAEAWAKIIYGESLLGKLNVFEETRERLAADNPWLFMAKEIEANGYEKTGDYVHPQDKEVIDRFTAGNIKDEHKLQLSMIPKPFMGNPLDAEVVVLTLNPGYSEKYDVEEYEKCSPEQKKGFIETKCRIMALQDDRCIQDGENEYMNLLEANYWKHKLERVLGISPDANKKVSIVEFMPYHSVRYKDIPKKLFSDGRGLLHTQEYTIRLVRYLMQQGKVIVITRAENKWYEHIPQLKYYKKKVVLNNVQNIYISPANCKGDGWKLIETALL